MGLAVQMRVEAKAEEWRTANFHRAWDAGGALDKLLEKQKGKHFNISIALSRSALPCLLTENRMEYY